MDGNGNIIKNVPGIGECTRPEFNTLSTAGVLLLDTHGGIGSIDAVTGPPFAEGTAPNNAPQVMWLWCAGQANADMEIVQRIVNDDNRWNDNNCWIVVVKNRWFSLNFNKGLSDNNAIVCVSACHSAEPLKDKNGNIIQFKDSDGNIIPAIDGNGNVVAESVMDAFGGRLRMGYVGCPTTDEAESDVVAIFGRMSGLLPNDPESAFGTLRISTDAYATLKVGEKVYTDLMRQDIGARRSISGFTPQGPKKPVKFISQPNYEGDGKATTLCPAVGITRTMRGDFPSEPQSAIPNVLPQPGSVEAAISGQGSIEFDTECNANVLATEVLTVESVNPMPSGGSKDDALSDVKWVGNSKITFKYRALCEGSVITLRINHLKVSGRAGVLYLDGNQSPNAPSSGGVAPSKDDFIWQFTVAARN